MKEHQHIEWKENWRDEYLKWIGGFADAEGGVRVIGRNDKGVAAGVKDAKKLLEDFPNKVRDILGILVDVHLLVEDGRKLIEIRVTPYSYPVSYKGEYHVRSGSTKQELKGAALDRFLLKRQGRHWDGVPLPQVSVADLDAKALAAFRRLAHKSRHLSEEILGESDAGLIDKLFLTDGKYLRRAAALLFHPEPERFVTGAWVKIGLFDTDLRHQDEVRGGLFSQVAQTIEVLRLKYLKADITYEGIQRIETFPVPDAALREAILNAIVHKDYASGVPVQISVYPDKLMIWNSGQLPPDWTIARLKGKHNSQPANPDIANAFFRAGQIEAWGLGIERIIAACKEAKVAEPEFEVDANGMWTTFLFAAQLKDPVKTPVETRGTTPKTTPKTTQKKILVLLKAQPSITRKELAERIGITLDGVKYHLAKMAAAGVVRHVGSARAGHWEVLDDGEQS
ncbi:helix-turn-helix domain-containing protein [soil metagenome]